MNLMKSYSTLLNNDSIEYEEGVTMENDIQNETINDPMTNDMTNTPKIGLEGGSGPSLMAKSQLSTISPLNSSSEMNASTRR